MRRTRSRKIAASRRSGCSATASTTSSSTRARQLRRRAAARDDRRQQGLRLRAAASRAEERAELDWLQRDWEVTDNFSLGLDFHDSRGESVPNDGITGGSQTAFSFAGKCRAPVTSQRGGADGLHRTSGRRRSSSTTACRWRRARCSRPAWPAAGTGGNPDFAFDAWSLGSQILRIEYQEQVTEIKQARLDGKFKFENGSTFDSASKHARWSAPAEFEWANDAG